MMTGASPRCGINEDLSNPLFQVPEFIEEPENELTISSACAILGCGYITYVNKKAESGEPNPALFSSINYVFTQTMTVHHPRQQVMVCLHHLHHLLHHLLSELSPHQQ